ncbi:hypothetical protein EIN_052290 [Entamoeba invadens IP1]|uniref:hypothetical protein n=1 Tax=Entamoeba invadens IP1 TaxID=370355 RepID=UPI0002C3D81D|nr:hypothetical protein EIN_052290 [Entamoeba invadens IP1]ELP93024.1 hypothetical protein EIN_052290 [Entamoeba invadens IP1]|eukprot:XP_004259795.1 hypothetical protein EIN_052290 [Entamoeba invadens IP1]
MNFKWSYVKYSLLALLSLSIVVLLVLLFIPNSPVKAGLITVFDFIEDTNKFLSALIVVGLFILDLVFMLPATPFTLACGYLYGLWFGQFVSFMGCFLGAFVSYLIGRFFGKSIISSYIEKHPKIGLIQKIVEKKGIVFIFMLRISPIFPFPVLNYTLGPVCGILSYSIGTALGLFPSNLLVTYFGTAISSVAEMFNGTGYNPLNICVLVGTTILSIVLLIGITIYTKRTMTKILNEEAQKTSVPDEEEGTEMKTIVRTGKKDNNNDMPNSPKDSKLCEQAKGVNESENVPLELPSTVSEAVHSDDKDKSDSDSMECVVIKETVAIPEAEQTEARVLVSNM